MSDITVTLIRDEISPELQRIARELSGAGRRRVLQVLGAGLVNLTQQAFKDASLRPLPWPPLKYRKEFNAAGKRIGIPLVKTGQLMRGIHISELTEDHVTVQPTVPYAIYHQLGAPKAHIPPRPFFPVTENQQFTPLARERLDAIFRASVERILKS